MSDETTRSFFVDDEDSAEFLIKILSYSGGIATVTLTIASSFLWPEGMDEQRAILLIRIYEALKVCPYIRELTLVNMDNFAAIDDILAFNKTITKVVIRPVCMIGNNSRAPDVEHIPFIFQRGPLIELHFSHCSEFNALSFANAIPENSTVTALSLSGCLRIDQRVEEICKAVQRCSVLSKLDLSYNHLNPDAGRAIGDMLKGNLTLTELVLKYADFGQGAITIINALLTNSVLKKLDLNRKCIEDISIGDCIADVLYENSTLTDLCLLGNEMSLSEIFDALQENTTLTKLEFRMGYTGFDCPSFDTSLDEMLQYNATLTDITIDQSCDTYMESYLAMELNFFIRALEGNETIRVLDLSCTFLCFANIESLGSLLMNNKSLVSLKLHAELCGSPPCLVFYEGLKANCTLKSLWFDDNKETLWTEEYENLSQDFVVGACAIAKALAVNTGLEHLTLLGTNLSAECVELLAVGLEQILRSPCLYWGNTALMKLGHVCLAKGWHSIHH